MMSLIIHNASWFILCTILLAFIFDFTNGFHDAGNAIATIVATRVLTPVQAVLWAAFFNFIAFLFFKLAVATMIGTGLVPGNTINPHIIFATLIGAISWNMLTWYFGYPSSSSHALLGGLAGAGIIHGGFEALQWQGFIKIIIATFLSPLLGMCLGFVITRCVLWFTKQHTDAQDKKWFKWLQLLSSAWLSITHGGNDAQKTMGLIAVLLYSSGFLGTTFYIPLWVVMSCYSVIALGTLTGGWRIINTMGNRITQLNPLRGTCAETSAAAVIFSATEMGIPVSTTHTVTGAIAGVGLSEGSAFVQWSVFNKIFLAWIITIPASATIAAGTMLLLKL